MSVPGGRPREPRISVLLPVFNAASTLRQAVESILGQDFRDFELLVVDDCSADGSAEIIAEYANADDRIRTIAHERNVGLPETLNQALAEARGEYAVRMDADDEALPQRLGVQLDFMERHPHVVVAGSYVYYMGARPEFDRLVTFPTGAAAVREFLRVENCIYHPTVIMRRGPILELGGYRASFRNAEDYDLWLRVRRHYELDNIPEPLLRYRVSVGGQTLNRRWEQLFYILLAQALDQDGKRTLQEARRDAADAVSQIDHKLFLAGTGTRTAVELARLHLWGDAWRVVRRLLRESGLRFVPALLAELAAAAGQRSARRFEAASPTAHRSTATRSSG